MSRRHANIDSQNFTGDVVKAVIDTLSGGTFPAAEAALDSQMQPIRIDLTDTLNSLASGCDSARNQGFVQFDAPVDPNLNRVTFRLRHPLDNPLGLVDTYAQAQALQQQAPSFLHPKIGLSQTQVNPGAPVTVNGNYFTAAEATLHVTWTDTTSGPVNETDIEWGPQGGQTQTVKQPRNGRYDGANQFQTGNLTPGARFQIRARDCDTATCTPWSDWLLATMAASGSDQAFLFLDSETQANQIGSTTLNPDGTFTAEPVIPSGTSGGTHMVFANVGGSVARTGIQPIHLVEPATRPPQPRRDSRRAQALLQIRRVLLRPRLASCLRGC